MAEHDLEGLSTAYLGSTGPANVADGSRVANAEGQVKDLDADRPAGDDERPQDVLAQDGVTRIFGGSLYETAAVIAEHYGWDFTNTLVVYIASGEDYPDALALGPSTFDDGRLLLVRSDSIPSATRQVLLDLEPCYIDLVGGTLAVNNQVFNDLKQYANPEYCEG